MECVPADRIAELYPKIEQLLRVIGEAKNLVLGISWIPIADCSALQCSEAPAFLGKPEAQDFRDQCGTFNFPPNVGIPGRVWASGKPEWSQNVQDFTIDQYPRVFAATDLGVRASFGFPIIDKDGRFVCVLEFFKEEECVKDEEVLNYVKEQTSKIVQ